MSIFSTKLEQDDAIRLMRRGVRPVFFFDSPNGLWGAGSCFVFKNGENFYLLTADHVIKNQSANYSDICVFQEGSKIALPLIEGFSPDDKVEGREEDGDFVIFKIDHQLYLERSGIALFAWDLSSSYPVGRIPENARVCFSGYPATETTYEEWGDRRIKPLFYMREGRVVPSTLGEGIYAIEEIDSPMSADGLSGSPVFFRDEVDLKFVGMIIRGSESGHLLHFIDVHFIRSFLLQYERRQP